MPVKSQYTKIQKDETVKALKSASKNGIANKKYAIRDVILECKSEIKKMLEEGYSYEEIVTIVNNVKQNNKINEISVSNFKRHYLLVKKESESKNSHNLHKHNEDIFDDDYKKQAS